MNYNLPKSLSVGGVEYEIRSDFRAVLDLCAALNDPELSDDDRGYEVLEIFYPGFEEMPPEHYNEAIQQCFRFINCGEEDRGTKTPRLMDWEQDFHHIIGPVNRVIGQDARGMDYLHWWSFVGAYREIGECFFSQIVGIRSKKAKNKPLDKSEREFYRHNQDCVDLKNSYAESEDALLKQWGA